MAYKNKTYVAFDGDTDMRYFNILKAWRNNKEINFDFYDVHSINTARDTSLTESIKRQLRERFDNSKLFLLLVGEKTKLNRKFIPWEIDQALKRELPIVVANLNGVRQFDKDHCPNTLCDELAVHVSFNAAIIQYAFDNWPDSDRQKRIAGDSGAYRYIDRVYTDLGL